MSAEVEDSPLLETVTKKRLVKTKQAGKDSVCCSELYVVEISDGAVITCSYESCGEVVNKTIQQSKTPSIVIPYT
jgi:hypothetical protein